MEHVSEKKSRWFSQFVEEELPKDVVSGKVFCHYWNNYRHRFFVAARTTRHYLGGEVVPSNRPSPRVDVMLTQLKEAVPHTGSSSQWNVILQDFSIMSERHPNEIRSQYDQIFCL